MTLHYTTPLEFKAPDVSGGEFVGYLAVFDSVDLGGDSIAPGSFRKSLAQTKSLGVPLPLLWAHDQSVVLGRFTDLQEDAKGLYVKGQLTLGTQAAREKYALLKDRAVTGLSIGYSIPQGGSERRGDVRVLKEIDLHEGSLVAVPMHSDARVVSVKSLSSPDDLVRALREGRPLQFEPASRRKAGPLADQLWAFRNGSASDEADLAREIARTLSLHKLVKE